MITKPLDAITSDDFDALVSNGMPEGKSLEYKRDLPGGGDVEKKEFLADVSSLANTAGGDLIFGIEEMGGVATAIVGLKSADLDADVRRLDDILAAGLMPRLRYAVRRVPHSSGVDLIVLRVERSWNAPHRVIFKSHDKFYARNSAGKYSLDVGELRDAFLLSSTLIDRLRDFHSSRLLEIAADRTPTPLKSGARLVVHLLPVSAFALSEQLDITPLLAAPDDVPPISGRGWNDRITLEGLLTFSQVDRTSFAYTHLYRTGVVEAVDAYVLNQEVNGHRSIPSITYESRLIERVGKYLEVQRRVGAVPPIYVLITLVGAKGLWLATSNQLADSADRYPIDREVLDLPAVVVQAHGTDIASALKPALDAVWHSCGFQGSLNFDAQGKWKPG